MAVLEAIMQMKAQERAEEQSQIAQVGNALNTFLMMRQQAVQNQRQQKQDVLDELVTKKNIENVDSQIKQREKVDPLDELIKNKNIENIDSQIRERDSGINNLKDWTSMAGNAKTAKNVSAYKFANSKIDEILGVQNPVQAIMNDLDPVARISNPTAKIIGDTVQKSQEPQSAFEKDEFGELTDAGELQKKQAESEISLNQEKKKSELAVEEAKQQEEQKKETSRKEANLIIDQLEAAYKKTTPHPSKMGMEKVSQSIEVGLSGLGATENQRADERYKKLLDQVKPALARAAGNTGQFTEPEQQRAVALAPSLFDTDISGPDKFKEMRRRFNRDRYFDTVEDAESSNLPKGTIIYVDGRKAVVE